MDFVSRYRRLNQLPKPVIDQFSVFSFFEIIIKLMGKEIDLNKISIDSEINPPDLKLLADPKQLEQLMINLVKNSIESMQDAKNGRIQFRAFRKDDHTILQVEDNGPGIPDDIIDSIFIPFFTTKDKGSGIGLSLSRQIMLLHEGTITAKSIPDVKTVFTLTF